jgi:two-component system, sensor histidine kinase
VINHTPATHQTSPLSPETLKVLETIPDLYLILSPDLTILTASNAYLAATHKRREEISGQYVFTVFPDNPTVQGTEPIATMANSYRQAIATGQPHTTDLIRYDLPLPSEQGSRFETRYWQVVNTPVLNEQGSIHYIIHKVIDVTDRVEKDKRLEESQLREQAAQAEANRQRQQFYNILMQAPALICLFEGPDHVFKLVNPPYQQLVGDRPILGKPIREAMPELEGQPIFGLLNQVYRTGESFYAYETLVQLDHDNSGGLGHNFYNFVYQPIRDLQGRIEGILVFAYEVTAQVRARQQIETLNEELQASNLELTNAKLALESLNQELEARVDRRTRELKVAQTETQRQKTRLERFFMQAPAAICIYDGPDLVYELVNPRYQQMFPGRDLLNQPLLKALPELAGHTVLHQLQSVYTTGQTYEEKALLVPLARHHDGPVEDLYFDFILQARYDEHGQIDGVMVFAYEVTEQVLANRKVEESEKQLRLITDAIPASIAYVDRELRYRFANKAALDWRQKNRETILGSHVEEIIGTASLTAVRHHLDRALSGEAVQFEDHINYPTGSRFIQSQLIPHHKDGNVPGFYAMITDITEQVVARQEAERQRQLLYKLFMEAPVPIVILDGPNQVYQLVNPAYQLIFPGRDLLGKALLKALPELKGTVIPNMLTEVYRTGETFVATELPLMLSRYHNTPPEEIFFTFTCQALRTQQGAIESIMIFAHDVTKQVKDRQKMEQREKEAQSLADELARANRELTESNHQLTRTNVDLDNFIYTASHDLKAPISNIESLLSALIRYLPPESLAGERTQRILSLMQESVERFKKTIASLTEVVKLQKENNTEAVYIDLLRVIREVSLDLEPLIGSAEAQIEVDVANCPSIHFSEKNLRSVIYNLLSNAIKYRSPERVPHIRIQSEYLPGYCVLTVSDNGLGLETDRVQQLFTMFKRLHTHVEGTGIGLYMVKKMVENAGGKIEVKSQVGEGTTFSVYFRN